MADTYNAPVDNAIAIVGANGKHGSVIANRVAQNGAVTVGYFGGRANKAHIDVTKGNSVESFLKTAVRHWRRLDTVIVASGPAVPIHPIADLPDEQFGTIIETEVIGAFNVVKRGVTFLQQQPGGNRSILFLLSTAVMRTLEYDGASAVPKMAVLGLIRQATREGSAGVRLNAIGVGSFGDLSIGSNDGCIPKLLAAIRTPSNRAGDPRELASVAAFLISKDASYISGQILGVDGGYSA